MTDLHVVGEFVRLGKNYDWGGGKWAGAVVRITAVQDEREVMDDEDSLIYEAEFVNASGEVCASGIPILPADIDESYDHYESERIKWWNNTVAFITGQHGGGR